MYFKMADIRFLPAGITHNCNPHQNICGQRFCSHFNFSPYGATVEIIGRRLDIIRSPVARGILNDYDLLYYLYFKILDAHTLISRGSLF